MQRSKFKTRLKKKLKNKENQIASHLHLQLKQSRGVIPQGKGDSISDETLRALLACYFPLTDTFTCCYYMRIASSVCPLYPLVTLIVPHSVGGSSLSK
ncbi:hypothetical protein CEXT_380171 [Caerostris extrusa]|uniref:Uncharacterized protein n=1 Tax=Caerostris extrusa TaxID=172846 RepID=A0AAV4SU94_CAEEX|nr:hypothetical protein CEXT_380171 [Caerostris extrusa]